MWKKFWSIFDSKSQQPEQAPDVSVKALYMEMPEAKGPTKTLYALFNKCTQAGQVGEDWPDFVSTKPCADTSGYLSQAFNLPGEAIIGDTVYVATDDAFRSVRAEEKNWWLTPWPGDASDKIKAMFRSEADAKTACPRSDIRAYIVVNSAPPRQSRD